MCSVNYKELSEGLSSGHLLFTTPSIIILLILVFTWKFIGVANVPPLYAYGVTRKEAMEVYR